MSIKSIWRRLFPTIASETERFTEQDRSYARAWRMLIDEATEVGGHRHRWTVNAEGQEECSCGRVWYVGARGTPLCTGLKFRVLTDLPGATEPNPSKIVRG